MAEANADAKTDELADTANQNADEPGGAGGQPANERPRERPAWLTWLADWRVIVPIVGAIATLVAWSMELNTILALVLVALLVGSVLAAVHHAEVIAERVGEPFGSITLAVAVTVIEVALIITLMISGGDEARALARDTVFAAVMLTCNGILGISVLIGALRDRLATFNAEGMATALATVATLATLSLVLPNFTTSAAGPEFSGTQLAFAAGASLVLYSVFLVVQTVRHRDQYVEDDDEPAANDEHHERPSNRDALISLAVLFVALAAVVGLTKLESPAIRGVITAIGAPPSAVGVFIAILVLLPETLTAVRSARRGRVQTSMTLALGSAIASIGLTVPIIAIGSIWLPGPLVLGLAPTQIVLLALTLVVGALTVLPGRATVQEGAIHIVLAGAFIFLALVP
jgi:Ca2+:H+ antiporter